MDKINYPKRPSEAEIQAKLWFELMKLGLDARLQVRGSLSGREHRLDIVIFRDQFPQCIVECKSWSCRYNKERHYQLTHNTKQIKKYQQWGIPVFHCGREEAISQVTQLILNSYQQCHFEENS